MNMRAALSHMASRRLRRAHKTERESPEHEGQIERRPESPLLARRVAADKEEVAVDFDDGKVEVEEILLDEEQDNDADGGERGNGERAIGATGEEVRAQPRFAAATSGGRCLGGASLAFIAPPAARVD